MPLWTDLFGRHIMRRQSRNLTAGARLLRSVLGALVITTLLATTADAVDNLMVGPWGGTSGGYNGPMNPPPSNGGVVVLDGGQSPMSTSFPTIPGQPYRV